MRREKREREQQIDIDEPGEYEFHFGMCPTCHKTDGYVSIEGWERLSLPGSGLQAGSRNFVQAGAPAHAMLSAVEPCSKLEVDMFHGSGGEHLVPCLQRGDRRRRARLGRASCSQASLPILPD
jgi:hypothetical protein